MSEMKKRRRPLRNGCGTEKSSVSSYVGFTYGRTGGADSEGAAWSADALAAFGLGLAGLRFGGADGATGWVTGACTVPQQTSVSTRDATDEVVLEPTPVNTLRKATLVA